MTVLRILQFIESIGEWLGMRYLYFCLAQQCEWLMVLISQHVCITLFHISFKILIIDMNGILVVNED